MVSFKKLRLSGFKSFVDNTELDIQSGLTGIVGPNGCGKSNLVEALRWVMGETSAKRMRGGEMDDVIFAGSTQRSARNVAEVALVLDNSDRKVPAQFNDFEELEVTRRIDRGQGSTYSVNGTETRARDVQLLFADAATGAHSTGLVSQGRIGAIVNAKPQDRRSLLEEAAGITGLHSRRHEAELRLKAAEANLSRLDDVIVTLENQLAQLKKQSRQASRYRNLNDQIRQTEGIYFHLLWQEAQSRLETVAQSLTEADTHVVALTSSSAIAATRQSEAAALLPPLRQEEAEKAAELQRLTIERGNLDQEEARLERETQDVERQLSDIAADQGREQAGLDDAAQAQEQLRRESVALQDAQNNAALEAEESTRRLEAAQAELERSDEAHAEVTHQLADAEARQQSFLRRRTDLQDRLARLTHRLENLQKEMGDVEAEKTNDQELIRLQEELAVKETHAHQAEENLRQQEEARRQAETQEYEARQDWQSKDAALSRLSAEEKALRDLLDSESHGEFEPILDLLEVAPGYEAALAAALGDDLQASIDIASPVHWRGEGTEGAFPLPEGIESLAQYVQGPVALNARLSQIGIAASEEDCVRLAKEMQQGQRLVTKDGALYRWDGFTVKAGTPASSQVRLERRNRLNALQPEIAQHQQIADQAKSCFEDLREQRGRIYEAEQQARENLQQASSVLRKLREDAQSAERRNALREQRLAGLRSALAELTQPMAEAEQGLAQLLEEETTLSGLENLRLKANELRSILVEKRAYLIECRSADEVLRKEAQVRKERLAAIERDLHSWEERATRGQQQMQALHQRQTLLLAELERLRAAPALLGEKKHALMDLLEQATQSRRDAADRLAEAENALREADRQLKEEETRLGEAREQRVRAEAGIGQAQEAASALTERILERLNCSPEETLHIAQLEPGEDMPDRAMIEAKVEKLHRERENMGPVNLRAEAEAGELDQQLNGMQSERSDLINAIARLRQGIASLNREGRERLLAAFELVNNHFQTLFTSLFGGGKAHLQLTEAEDPLDAGLEIFASPPGKRLQVLSLLSGGEQALTALALLFAVFLVNPAPICVLDEVDAPLDDANVERFCNLVEDLARKGETRFLIITHHRLTMARMDRLFGVTMAERGISQLVSVDLQQAAELRHAQVA